MLINTNLIKKGLLFFLMPLTLFFVCSSCEEGLVMPIYDTIYPESYYPAYPGSYWNYVNSSGEESQVATIDEYQLHSYYPQYTSDEMTEPKFVPQFVDGGYLYGYSFRFNAGIYSSSFITLFGEELNTLISHSVGPPSIAGVNYKLTAVVDTTVIVKGVSYYPTIEVKEYEHAAGPLDVNSLNGIYYYTENVGLVKYVSFPFDGSNEITLDSYFIND